MHTFEYIVDTLFLVVFACLIYSGKLTREQLRKRFYPNVIGIFIVLISLIAINFSAAFASQQSSVTDTPDQSKEFNSRLNSYFVADYIRSREHYSYDSVAWNYNVVRLMSEPAIYRDFVNAMDPHNQESNIARLGRNGSRDIKFTSITFVEPQLVEAHFVINEKNDNSTKQYNKVARMKIEYVKMNLTADEQLINPLGFRVLSYQLTDDAL